MEFINVTAAERGSGAVRWNCDFTESAMYDTETLGGLVEIWAGGRVTGDTIEFGMGNFWCIACTPKRSIGIWLVVEGINWGDARWETDTGRGLSPLLAIIGVITSLATSWPVKFGFLGDKTSEVGIGERTATLVPITIAVGSRRLPIPSFLSIWVGERSTLEGLWIGSTDAGRLAAPTDADPSEKQQDTSLQGSTST